MVNFVNLARPPYLDLWSDIILDVSVKAFLDEVNAQINRL